MATIRDESKFQEALEMNCEGCGKLVSIKKIPIGVIEILCGSCRRRANKEKGYENGW